MLVQMRNKQITKPENSSVKIFFIMSYDKTIKN